MAFTKSLLPILLLLLQGPTVAAQDCQACVFDGHDPTDCIIYGKLNDQVVEWSPSGSECKGYYNIAITGINPGTSCDSVNAFVNSLRFGDLQASDSKLGLGVSSEGGAFFYQNEGRIDLVDEIIIDGVTTNCAARANDCYDAMKLYFHDEGEGAKEYEQVCETLYNKVRVDRNLEESTLRIRLCQEHKEGNLIILECDPLAEQVKDAVKANPDTDCSAFGLETPLETIAGCETATEVEIGDGADESREISSTSAAEKVVASVFSFIFMVAAVM